MNGPRRSVWRSSCIACVGALFVLVLLAAIGMPCRSSGWMSSGWTAAIWTVQPRHAHGLAAGGEERLARSSRLHCLSSGASECPRQALAGQLPRGLPRTRTVAARGLPPPRAPCA